MPLPGPDFLRRSRRSASVDLRFLVPTIKLLSLLKSMLKGKKTYVAAALGILTAVGGYLTGDMSLAETMKACFEGVMAMTIRHGIANS